MRVLRRIGGYMRFGAKDNMTDLEVRTHLMRPSFVCLIMRKRLLYAPRICGSKCNILEVLLSQCCKGKALSWVQLFQNDLQYLFTHMHANICETYKLVHVPDPSLHPGTWLELMNAFKWHELVSKVFFLISDLDSHVKSEDAARDHVCNICIAGVTPAKQA